MPTNHERFVGAFKGLAGRELYFSEIKEIILNKFPKMKVGNIMPWDHDDVGNKNPCWCSKTEYRIFDRLDRRKPCRYHVRPNFTFGVPINKKKG